MTSKVESFSTRNFVTFPDIKYRIRTKFKNFKICILSHVTWTITFDTVAQIIHWIGPRCSSYQYLSNDILFGFAEVQILPLFFDNDVICYC